MEDQHAVLCEAQQRRAVSMKLHAHNVAAALADKNQLSLLVMALSAWARLAERKRLQQLCELRLCRLQQEQEQLLLAVREQRESDIHGWAKKMAHSIMGSKLQETLIIVVSSWMRVSKCQRHRRELEVMKQEVNLQKVQLQQER